MLHISRTLLQETNYRKYFKSLRYIALYNKIGNEFGVLSVSFRQVSEGKHEPHPSVSNFTFIFNTRHLFQFVLLLIRTQYMRSNS